MSIEELTVEQQPPSLPQENRKHWYTFFRSPLWLYLLLALLVRVGLTLHTHGIIDTDESLVGLQAQGILHGDFPIYFYGIPYFGSLEAYLAAGVFAIIGPSTWALRIEATLVSLLQIVLTWKLAEALAEAVQLPRYARRIFMNIAALIAVVPPLYDAVIEIRTFGGYVETFVLMLLLLLSVFKLTRRWDAGASVRELAWRWAGIGFIVGLGLWVYPLIFSALLASTLWILWNRIAAIITLKRQKATSLRVSIISSLKHLWLVVAAIPTCIIGLTPALIWGASHSWENVVYIQRLGGGWSPHRLSIIRSVTRLYATCIAPRVISGALPLEDATLRTIHSPLFIFGTFCILTIAALVCISLVWHKPALLRIRRLAALPTLFAACTAFAFCTSTASGSGLYSCDFDFAGRYATPLMLTFPFFFATIFTAIIMYLHERLIPIGTFHVDTLGADNPAWGAGNERPSPIYRPATTIAQGLLFTVLFAYVCVQAITYGLTNADLTFQSPYCLTAPANNDSIIAYMQHEQIHYAWATNFLAYPIVFKTNSRIIMADPLPLMHPDIAINRIPAYTNAVLHAERPSILVLIKHGNPHPLLLRQLDARGITYRTALFPSEPGVDVLVVTPLNRSVPLLDSKDFDLFYCNEY